MFFFGKRAFYQLVASAKLLEFVGKDEQQIAQVVQSVEECRDHRHLEHVERREKKNKNSAHRIRGKQKQSVKKTNEVHEQKITEDIFI